MEEIGRFIRNLFSSIIYQFRIRAMDAINRKVRETFNQLFERLQKPKKQEQAQDDRK